MDKKTVLRSELQIRILKGKLYETDYQAIKYAEGSLSEEEFLPIKKQRQQWRKEINELQESIVNKEI